MFTTNLFMHGGVW